MALLRERMAEDLRIRNDSPRTIRTYVSMVSRFASQFEKPPGRLGPEEVRAFQLGLIDQRVSWSLFNQAVCALRFFYRVTVPRDFVVEHIPFAKRKKPLPLVLSVDEVRRLLGDRRGLGCASWTPRNEPSPCRDGTSSMTGPAGRTPIGVGHLAGCDS